ncbi:catalase-like domain-containing protein [Paraphoma chrysanthemicola]|uniref:catalase n=1 Tax=Paraphoma chrysanthemicola TaxID=798071 RepID=A0A8K0R6J9_9PLEO|nr:catalase-like domain-containing protein [Paraphoma chrysanthemicola]
MHSEAMHMFFSAMSDRIILPSYRMMQGSGVNTFTPINDKGERQLVRFIFTPELGPKWMFGIQVFPEDKENDFDFDFDILDATKLELRRNPDEFFTQTEQVAFCTGHLELPINKPICFVMNFKRDGAVRHIITKEEGAHMDFLSKVAGINACLYSKKFKEHKNQVELFCNSLAEPEKIHTVNFLRLQTASLRRPNSKAKGLSQLEYMSDIPTIATRMVALFIADAALIAAGALTFTISPRRNKHYTNDEAKSFGGSTMFDSILVSGGAKAVETLCKNGCALNAIPAMGEAVGFVHQAIDLQDVHFSTMAMSSRVMAL